MKESPDDKIIAINDPLGGKNIHFEIDKKSNASLILRLIKKREKTRKEISDLRSNLDSVRKESNLTKIEEESEKVAKQYMDLDSKLKDGDITEEDHKKETEKLDKKTEKLRDQYPEEAIEITGNIHSSINKINRLGLKICSIILKPVDKIPDDYNSLYDYIEEVIIDDNIDEIIGFFLNSLTTYTKSHTESDTSVKFLKRKELQKEG